MFVSEDRPSRRTTDFLVNRIGATQGAALCYGRFLQADPLGYGDGMNMYNYVGSDPINSTDPSGLAECAGTESQNGNCSITVTGSRASNTGFVVNVTQTAYSTGKAIFKGLSSIFGGKKKKDQTIISNPTPVMAASALSPKLNGPILGGPTGFPGRVLLSNSQIQHIISRHGYNTAPMDSGRFNQDLSNPDGIMETAETALTIGVPDPMSFGTFTATFPNYIAETSAFNGMPRMPTSRVKVSIQSLPIPYGPQRYNYRLKKLFPVQ